MVTEAPIPARLPTAPALRQGTLRTGERGAAMFLVLMVILILTGIGTFALSNARSEVQSSGFMRHRGVALEMASFGAQAAMNEVAMAPTVYRSKMSQGVEKCLSNAGMMYASPAPPCARLYLISIETRTNMLSEKLVRAADIATSTPGSLGLTKLTAGFFVEMTDPLQVTRPRPGTAMGDSGGLTSPSKFLDVTLTSTGVLFYDDNGNGAVDWTGGEGQGAVFTTARGHVVVGPL